uniref:Uncharacterized protein n=1 Tax=Cacopsylla melanoneura TaxID=428564 RepID=A0A8D9C0T5_9HEMI
MNFTEPIIFGRKIDTLAGAKYTETKRQELVKKIFDLFVQGVNKSNERFDAFKKDIVKSEPRPPTPTPIYSLPVDWTKSRRVFFDTIIKSDECFEYAELVDRTANLWLHNTNIRQSLTHPDMVILCIYWTTLILRQEKGDF